VLFPRAKLTWRTSFFLLKPLWFFGKTKTS
jgi:hypothetical protein